METRLGNETLQTVDKMTRNNRSLSLTALASIETTTISALWPYTIVGKYSWHTNFSSKAIVSLLRIAFTPRAEKSLMSSSSASVKVSCANKKVNASMNRFCIAQTTGKLKIRQKF